MLEKLFHWLFGYARFRVVGDGARFFTICAKSRIGLWGYRRESGQAMACVRAREYRKLRRISRRAGVRLRVMERKGLPFWLQRLSRRKGLVMGALCGAALYVFLSGFTWGVTVSGTQKLPDSLILDAARHCGIYVGSRLDGQSPRGANAGIQTQVAGLSWVGVNTDGCFTHILVNESSERPRLAEKGGWSNIVAAREGQVVEIQAASGRPEVALGDTVVKGQLLISGLYQERQDPWAEPLEDPLQVTGQARGSVVAETYREFTVQVSAKKNERLETGWVQSRYTLCLFGLRIPLGMPFGEAGENVRCWQETYQAKALGTVLPLSIQREARAYGEKQVRVLSEEEQKEQALLKLRQAQRAGIAPGGRVAQEELVFSFTEGACILQAKCRCREEIGVVQEILVE